MEKRKNKFFMGILLMILGILIGALKLEGIVPSIKLIINLSGGAIATFGFFNFSKATFLHKG